MKVLVFLLLAVAVPALAGTITSANCTVQTPNGTINQSGISGCSIDQIAQGGASAHASVLSQVSGSGQNFFFSISNDSGAVQGGQFSQFVGSAAASALGNFALIPAQTGILTIQFVGNGFLSSGGSGNGNANISIGTRSAGVGISSCGGCGFFQYATVLGLAVPVMFNSTTSYQSTVGEGGEVSNSLLAALTFYGADGQTPGSAVLVDAPEPSTLTVLSLTLIATVSWKIRSNLDRKRKVKWGSVPG